MPEEYGGPQDFARRKSGERRVCRDFKIPLLADKGMDFFAFGGGALVAPQDSRTQHLVVFVQHNKRMHLTGQPNAAHGSGVCAALLKHGARAGADRLPPVLRILFRPAVLGLCHRIFHSFGCSNMPVGIKQDGFRTRGPDVDSK